MSMFNKFKKCMTGEEEQEHPNAALRWERDRRLLAEEEQINGNI